MQERLFTLTVATSDPHVAQLVDDQSNITQTLSFLVVPDTKSSYFVGVHSIITKILRFFLLPDAQPLFIFDPQSNITQTLTFLLVPNTESSLLLNAAFNVNETVSFLVVPDTQSSVQHHPDSDLSSGSRLRLLLSARRSFDVTQTVTFLVLLDVHSLFIVDAQSNVTESLVFLVVPDAESSFLVDARHVGIARLLLRLSADDNVTLASVDYTVRVSQKISRFHKLLLRTSVTTVGCYVEHTGYLECSFRCESAIFEKIAITSGYLVSALVSMLMHLFDDCNVLISSPSSSDNDADSISSKIASRFHYAVIQ